MSKKKMLMVVAAVALGFAGAVSSAQAGNDKYDDGGQTRGIKIGPLGQIFGAPPAPGAFAFSPPASGAFAFAPRTTRHVRVHGRY